MVASTVALLSKFIHNEAVSLGVSTEAELARMVAGFFKPEEQTGQDFYRSVNARADVGENIHKLLESADRLIQEKFLSHVASDTAEVAEAYIEDPNSWINVIHDGDFSGNNLEPIEKNQPSHDYPCLSKYQCHQLIRKDAGIYLIKFKGPQWQQPTRERGGSDTICDAKVFPELPRACDRNESALILVAKWSGDDHFKEGVANRFRGLKGSEKM
ncbi:hypothetical protein DM02DRAFT_650663 [Periconia macrospinosa]|uniref:Uncharacterized protein n=1 Tax=Periconia macrospinosa TaxID=97972 RepID=A0A2V1E8L2_9PLEO|nr:hypothetical protein DM02DRAFT_650663 [Periconia macrospinosa]